MSYFFREKRDAFERTKSNIGWKGLTALISREMSLNREGDEEYDADPVFVPEPFVSCSTREYRDLLSAETRCNLEKWEHEQKKVAPTDENLV